MNYREIKEARWKGKPVLSSYPEKIVVSFYDEDGQFDGAIQYKNSVEMCKCLSSSHIHVYKKGKKTFYKVYDYFKGYDDRKNRITEYRETSDLVELQIWIKEEYLRPELRGNIRSHLDIYEGDERIDEFFDLFLINDEWDGQYFDDGVADNHLAWKKRKVERYLGTKQECFIPRGILKEYKKFGKVKHQLGEESKEENVI